MERFLGLNPNNPTDALEDPDFDGLSNKDEFQRGTNLRNPDTDNDGLKDGDEVTRGTNPLLPDTDNDGVPDGLEVQLGTNPLLATSVNLAAALTGISATPSAPVLTVNNITPEASVQLAIRGTLRDNSTLDLTPTSRGTTYSSSNLTICNFGAEPGRVFAGNPGTCVITIRNSGFEAQVPITVRNFAPVPLSNLALPGALAIEVVGNTAYVAAGAAGLHIVNITNRNAPTLLRTLPLPGTAKDVRISGNTAYVAAGSEGLHLVNITNPNTAFLINTVDTPGDAQDLAIRAGRAYVADGASGLHIIDVVVPAFARILGTIATGGPAIGVDVDPTRQIAAVAQGGSGLRLVDVSNPSAPVLKGLLPGGNVQDVLLRNSTAYLADYSRSFSAVDTTNPDAPTLSSSTPAQFGGFLYDIAINGTFAFGADEFFVNGTPVIDISSPLAPSARFILNFPGDATGTGVAADIQYVYLIAGGTLFIGQYQAPTDTGTVPPVVSIASPAANSTVIARSTIPVTVNATDDVAVAAVSILVNGTIVGTKATSPYEFNITVPTTAQFNLSARAIDLAGNTGNSPTITINTTIGPVTSVTGRGLDRQGNPIPNAAVNVVNEFTSTSAADGRFTIANVPAAINPIRVYGQATINNIVLRGRSNALVSVPNGITNIGDIIYFPDADWDGLPDDFEAANACLKPNTPDTDDDPDNDNQTNLQEYQAGTNPCLANLLPGTREAFSPLFSIQNGAVTPTLPPGQNETISPLFSIANQGTLGELPPGQNEAISPLFSLQNGLIPTTFPTGQNETVSPLFSLYNGLPPGTLPAGQNETVSPLFSLYNGLPLGTLPAGQNETISPLFSLLNGITGILLPGQSETVSSLFSIRNGPPPTSSVQELTNQSAASAATEQDITLSTGNLEWTAGETVELRASSNAAIVEYFADGVSLGIVDQPPFSLHMVAPHGAARVQIRAIGRDASTNPLWARDRMVTIRSAEFHTVAGRLLRPNSRPAANTETELFLPGLTAEWFDFTTPLNAIPDLQNRTPDSIQHVSSLTFRNPERIFGGDPFGAAMAPDFAARFRGLILIEKEGEHTFSLRGFESSRLSIDGKVVVDGNTSGKVNLTAGAHNVEILYFSTIGAPELIWSFTPPGETKLRAVPPEILRSPMRFKTARDGRFALPGLPKTLNQLYLEAAPGASALPVSQDGATLRVRDIVNPDQENRQ
ncbi:MAG: Ig-like domain-containing protein [Bryobacteraceae bacterium]